MAEPTNDANGVPEEDRLPWLEAVEDEDEEQGVAPAKLIGGVIAALAVVGLVVGGAKWVHDRNAAAGLDGPPETIAAAEGPYKVKPSEPGGMAVPGQGDTSYAASQGADPNASMDLSAVPEAPVTGTKAAPAAEPAKPKPAPAVAAPKPEVKVAAKPVEKPAAAKPAAVAAGTIQLGSFLSEAKANAAWTSLSKRFAFLGGLDKSVATATVNSAKVYRLRVSAADPNGICGKLKVAGETCMVVKS